MTLPPPNQLGLPEYFGAWRAHQQDTIQQALAAQTRFVGINAPTGAGKSVLAEVIAQFSGGRSAYLVMTKPLADQITDPERGIPYRFDVRGKSNYACELLNQHGLWGSAATCDKAEALCQQCGYKETSCTYYSKCRQATKERHPVTNYDFWLNANEHKEGGIGAFDLLICDEAHDIFRKLSSYMRIELDPQRVERGLHTVLPGNQPLQKWRQWAAAHYGELAMRLEAMQQAVKNGAAHPTRELSEVKRLTGDLLRLSSATDDWVEDREGGDRERGERGLVGFEPVNVAPYAGKLWCGVPRVLLMSALLRDKHFADLGISKGEYTLIEAPSSIEVRRRPIVHVKTVQQRATMTEAAQLMAVQRVDQIAASRLDAGRKGIVHTASYARAQHLQLHSAHSGLMMLHDSKGTARVVQQFIISQQVAILVSPSITTGYNFADDAARWQVILKVPFEPSSPVSRARKAQDPDAGKFAAWVEFAQAAGRIVRGPDDWGETFCTDDSIVWLYVEALRKGWVPGWMQPAVQLNKMIPGMLRLG